MAVAITGLMTNLVKPKSNLISLLRAELAMVKATKWQATDAHAAPFTPNAGLETKIKFKMSLTITPAP